MTRAPVVLAAVAAVALFRLKVRAAEPVRGAALAAEIAALLAVLAAIGFQAAVLYAPDFRNPPRIDLAISTREVSEQLVTSGANPYRNTHFYVYNQDPKYSGFKYGPLFAAAYAPGAPFGAAGYKGMNLAYLLAAAVLIFFLALETGASPAAKTAAGLFAAAAFLLPDRSWFETLYQGTHDSFPLALLLGSALCFRARKDFAAGLLTGLLLSTKFGYAVPWIAVTLRPARWKAYLAGALTGTLPLVGYAVADWRPLFENYILFSFAKNPNGTSLYSLSPETYWGLFSGIQAAALLAALLWGWRRDPGSPDTHVAFFITLGVVSAVYREVHGNHLIYLQAFAALALVRYRYALFGFFLGKPT